MNRKQIIKNCIIIILILVVVLIICFAKKNNKDISLDNQISSEINDKYRLELGKPNDEYVLSVEDSNRIIQEIKEEFKDTTTDKVILYLNEEPIKEKEIAFKRYQLNEKSNDAEDELIKDYVICQNAEELNISLSEREMKKIENTPNLDEDTRKLAEATNMTYEDFNEMYINMEKRAIIETKWVAHVGEKIINGELKVNSEIFENKYKDYKKAENVEESSKLLLELLELYKEYLVEQADIKYVN